MIKIEFESIKNIWVILFFSLYVIGSLLVAYHFINFICKLYAKMKKIRNSKKYAREVRLWEYKENSIVPVVGIGRDMFNSSPNVCHIIKSLKIKETQQRAIQVAYINGDKYILVSHIEEYLKQSQK